MLINYSARRICAKFIGLDKTLVLFESGPKALKFSYISTNFAFI